MNLIKKITLIILIFQLYTFGQIKPGAKQISLSHSSFALANDAFAIFTNPAGLAQLNWREFGAYYSPSPFGISKLANGSAAYHEPSKYGSFGLAFTTYGFELYKENNFFVSYSKLLFNNFFLGATFGYHNLTIKNYGSATSFTILFRSLF